VTRLDVESELFQDLDGAGLAALEVAGGKPLADASPPKYVALAASFRKAVCGCLKTAASWGFSASPRLTNPNPPANFMSHEEFVRRVTG
jgi:hypothetical protein